MANASYILVAGVRAHLVSVDEQQQHDKELTQDQHDEQTQVLMKRRQ